MIMAQGRHDHGRSRVMPAERAASGRSSCARGAGRWEVIIKMLLAWRPPMLINEPISAVADVVGARTASRGSPFRRGGNEDMSGSTHDWKLIAINR